MVLMEKFIKKLISKLKAGIDKECVSSVPKIRLCDAISIVNQLSEEYNNGWISCDEQLPEDSVSVIGWDEQKEREFIVQYVWGCWVLDYQWQLSKPEELYITYWQPMIPRPQKRGE